MCFRKKDKMNLNKSNQLAPVPKSPKKDGDNAQPIQRTTLNETGGVSQTAQAKKLSAVEDTQKMDKQDSLTSLKPSVKTAKRGEEIARTGVVSGKRKKEYKTVNLEDMSNFDKTMTVAQETSCTDKSKASVHPEDAKKSIQ